MMQLFINTTKKATNISQSCDQFLRELVLNEHERRQQLDNADFIAVYNQTVADEGLPLDSWRSF